MTYRFIRKKERRNLKAKLMRQLANTGSKKNLAITKTGIANI